MKHEYPDARHALEPIVSHVDWSSPGLPSSDFRRDACGRWHLTSWRGDSYHHLVESIRCRAHRLHSLRCRGWTWLELTLRINPDGPVVIDDLSDLRVVDEVPPVDLGTMSGGYEL